MAALHLYVRILVVLLALAGVAALAGLQAGWLVPAASDLSRGPDDRDGENIADNSGLDNAVTGPTKVQSQLIPVDTSLTYQISAEVRAFSPEDDLMAGTRIHFGVETYDAEMRLLRSGLGGTHRYSGTLNRVLQPVSGWVTLSGVMAGEGDERHDQFRPGTRYVRVVALLNFRTPGMRTAIRNVRFGPRISLEPDD